MVIEKSIVEKSSYMHILPFSFLGDIVLVSADLILGSWVPLKQQCIIERILIIRTYPRMVLKDSNLTFY